MRTVSQLALAILLAPVLVQAPAPAPAAAPTFSQRYKAGKPEVDRHMGAFEFREAYAAVQGILPDAKPAFDNSSVNAVRTSCWNSIEASQAYTLAHFAAGNAGQWEKAIEYLNKGLEIAKANQEACAAPLTQAAEAWGKSAGDAQALLTTNADAIKELKAKAQLESFEKERMERVQAWEKDFASADKVAKIFKGDIQRTAWEVENLQKLITHMENRIKDQQQEIADYKARGAGDKQKQWVEAVVASPSYMDAIQDRGDKIALLCRLSVLDPENRKVDREIDVLMGKAAPSKPKKK